MRVYFILRVIIQHVLLSLTRSRPWPPGALRGLLRPFDTASSFCSLARWHRGALQAHLTFPASVLEPATPFVGGD